MDVWGPLIVILVFFGLIALFDLAIFYVFQAVFYFSGALIVEVFSAGSIQCAPIGKPSWESRKWSFWPSKKSPVRTLSCDYAFWIGVLAWAFVFLLVWLATSF